MTTRKQIADRIIVRATEPRDIEQIIDISQRTFGKGAWMTSHIQSHLDVFPEGQLVAVDPVEDRVVGSASSLMINWDDYTFEADEDERTDDGFFTNHNPRGRTLWGAGVEVDPACRRMGIGKKIYKARRQVVRDLGLLRIRAGARLRGYSQYKHTLTPTEYAIQVVNRVIDDPTLTFQLHNGFRVIGVIHDHLADDPESCGHVAIIEWLNHRVASYVDYKDRDARFGRKRKRT